MKKAGSDSTWQPLKRVFAENESSVSPTVRVSFSAPQADGLLGVRFEVTSDHAPCVNDTLPGDKSQWGLWDWDVVEVFLSANATPVYYEFQLSPAGQFFELEIFEPRKRVNKDFNSEFRHSVVRGAGNAWVAEFKIPLVKLGWDGKLESLRGNAFAILGAAGAKSYCSLHLPRQLKPDFHLPQFFKPLF